MSPNLSKRHVLAAGGGLAIAALFGEPTTAQDATPIDIDISPDVAASMHSMQLFQGRETTVEDDPLSSDSLDKAIIRLVELKVLEQADAEVVRSIVAAVLNGKALDAILNEIDRLYKEAAATLGKLAAVVVSLIRDSVQQAKELLSSKEVQVVIRAIAHDIRGALDGAAEGASTASFVPKVGIIFGAVFGAIVGAGTASTLGFFDQSAS